MEAQPSCPLPEDPTLAAWAVALNDARQWAEILDARWCSVYMTDEARMMYSGGWNFDPYPVGVHLYGPENVSARMQWGGGHWPLAIYRRSFATVAAVVLADTPGGREELREHVDPRLRDIVDGLRPIESPTAWTHTFRALYSSAGAGTDLVNMLIRARDRTGRLAGTVFLSKPAVGMATLARITGLGDLRHFERMDQVARPGRRPAAVLFADLEASARLARRLSAASYFALGRRIVRVADQCVIDAGGLVGRHAGDGVVGFFLVETTGSEAAAARACIEAARAIKEQIVGVAARSELAPEELSMRFGLHWGATLYVGQIATSGRTEVNGLGDEVNEAARIEACASGGRILASKPLIERLGSDAAAALDINLDRIAYTALGDLPTATDKARRDAPAIAVCEL